MLLYQITNWLQKRSSLRRAIAQEDGGSPEQNRELQEVERQLSSHTERFMQAYSRASFIQDSYSAPNLDEDMYY
jgi:hypothetical protein